MEAVKLKRTPLRSAFTKAVNALNEEIEKEELNIPNIEILLEQLENKNERLKLVDEEILNLLLSSKVSEEDYEKEFESCESYTDKFINLKTTVKQLITRRNMEIKDPVSYEKEENKNFDLKSSASASNFKLPKINLIEFDGEPRNWLTFWNTFKKIDEDANIDRHSKFVYLIQATTPKSKARQIVQSYPTTEENYPKVIEHLKTRFGNEEMLIQLYIRDLLNLVLNNNNNATKKTFNLSLLYDNIESKLRALESLGVTEDKYENILFPLVESCLPHEILRVWEREREKTAQGKSDLKSILQFLKNEVLSEERIMLARFSFDKTRKSSKTNESEGFNVSTCTDLYTSDKSKEKFNAKRIEDCCLFCDKPHLTDKCFKANALSYEDKKNLILKKGACFICLKRNHISRFCKSKVKCTICGNRHLTVFCQQRPSQVKEDSVITDVKQNANVLTNREANSEVLLQTLIVRVKNGNREKVVRAIIDTGSERTYLTDDLIHFLKYDNSGEVRLIHKLFGGLEMNEKVHYRYTVNLSSLDNKYNCYVSCLNESTICSDVKKIPKGPWLNELNKHNIRVSDVESDHSRIDNEIKLLIGSDVAGKLFTGNIRCLKSGPVAMQTRLGWVLMGKIPGNETSNISDSLACVSLFLCERSAENFWKLDVIGITDPAESKTKAEIHEETLQYFKNNLRVDSDGRYEVALPWVLDSSRLPSNRELAEKRLSTTRKKLLDANKIEVYEEVFDNWLKDQIIEEVPDEKVNREHYLPHRPVFKESSETTKTRPVFDASCHVKGCLSLNDCLEKGPNMIEIIPSLFNRFRKYSVGVVSDIEKAFLQIGIREIDRDYLRFLWTNAKDNKNKIYRHRRVVFGLNCSPFLLAATLNYHVDSAPEQFLATAKILKESMYVDNCISSFKSVEDASKFVLESRLLLSSAKFNLRGWQSNCVIKVIPNSELDTTTCVLGLNWHLRDDTISCRIEHQNEEKISASKRTLLSCTQKLFDPVGFTSPVTLIPKLILQECWKLHLNWDEDLPEELEKKFFKWINKLNLLSKVKIPRWLNVGRSEDEEISIHIFCDSSKYAYATCIFMRVQTVNRVYLNFVQARTRVAPLKNVTIPRLELLSCLIGARLGSAIISDLSIPELEVFYWTDSTTALCWIQRNIRWGTFVWNRVQEIRTLSKVEQWRHIPSELNAADLPSRGCSVEEFLRLKWWEGPVWLLEPKSSWPQSVFQPDEEVIDAEKRKTVLTAHNKDSKPDNWYYRYFSSYQKIVRLLGWILRFVNNARKKIVHREIDLSFSELEMAEKALFLLIQKDAFDKHDEDRLKNLRVMIDKYGIFRVKTQVMFRQDTDDFRYPVLLPSEHPVVHLLILYKHVELLHAGVCLLMAKLRENFWILKARKTIRSVVQRCVRCKRFNAKKTESESIALPCDRVQDAAVFQIVGVDLAGPLYLKGGRKSWIVLYTCAVYRAVHLELVTSLSTEVFLQSFRRFIARRGRPTTVYSDNGSNFVGANNALLNIDWEQIASKTAVEKINWKFNPPTAAWWGGWWERLVQLIKKILRKVLGKAVLSYEELFTVLCDCEQVINARPITYVTEDVDGLTPLTPSLFLQEMRSDVTDFDNLDCQGLTNRLKYIQQVREHLRRRFRLEYLGQLRQHTISTRKTKPLSIDDIVLVESDQKRTFWSLARVIQLFPGKDGNVRVAKVKTENSEFLRPVQKLYNLEVGKDTLSDPIICTRSGRQIKPPKYFS